MRFRGGWKLGAALLVSVGLLLVYCFIVPLFLPVSSCTDTYHPGPVSPDGRLKSAVHERDCGATTGFDNEVLITAVGRAFEDEPTVVVVIDGPPPRLEWDGADLRVFKGKSEIVRTSKPPNGASVSFWNAD